MPAINLKPVLYIILTCFFSKLMVSKVVSLLGPEPLSGGGGGGGGGGDLAMTCHHGCSGEALFAPLSIK